VSAVVAGTKARLEKLLPGRIGDNKTFSTSYVESLILAGFYDVCERCNLLPSSEDVTLANDTLIYDLTEKFIEITSVEWVPGDTTRQGHLKAVTLSDLDKMSRKWRDDRGTRPEYYCLLSAPGIPETSTDAGDGSRIVIWRPLSTVDDDKIRVNGIISGTAATPVPDDVQRLCLVPYVLSHLKAVQNPQAASGYMAIFEQGCETVRGRFSHRYDEETHGPFTGIGL